MSKISGGSILVTKRWGKNPETGKGTKDARCWATKNFKGTNRPSKQEGTTL